MKTSNKNKKNQTRTSSFSLEDIENTSWNNFCNMLDGVEYTFTENIRQKYNTEAKKYPYYEPKQNEYQFRRNGSSLFYSYDFGKNFLKLEVKKENFALALAANEIKKVNEGKDNNKVSCNGKVVEIDGKKYKLTEVK